MRRVEKIIERRIDKAYEVGINVNKYITNCGVWCRDNLLILISLTIIVAYFIIGMLNFRKNKHWYDTISNCN